MDRHRNRGIPLSLTAAAVVLVVGSTAAAAPTDSTTLTFEVSGPPGGGLHLSVAPEGGVRVVAGPGARDTVLPGVLVRDDRGSGARHWSASVGTAGFGKSIATSYKVASLSLPDTGLILNRMPDWSQVGAPLEAVAATGISRPSVSSTWQPHLRLEVAGGVTGSGTTSSHLIGGTLITSVM